MADREELYKVIKQFVAEEISIPPGEYDGFVREVSASAYGGVRRPLDKEYIMRVPPHVYVPKGGEQPGPSFVEVDVSEAIARGDVTLVE